MTTYTGTPDFPLTAMIRDTIDIHGLRFAVRYYSKKFTPLQMRVLFRGAYL